MFEQVEKAHDADLHCVDWNAHDENLLLSGYHFSLFEDMFLWQSQLSAHWNCNIIIKVFEL